ncbi:MAG: class I SAM-dependent methyltransferase [Alphaproteobacteria bacterium]
MDTEKLGTSRFLNILSKFGGAAMESRLRHWFADPKKTLRGAGLEPGQTVLEVGSGTGFFTLPAAGMIGDTGRLIAMDPLASFVDRLKKKVEDAGLTNVEVVRRDALNTELEVASIDVVLLFGVVPFPTLPLNRLLPEMHRVLKAEGILAVWLFPSTAGVPTSIRRSGLFCDLGKKHGVYTYRRADTIGGDHAAAGTSISTIGQ